MSPTQQVPAASLVYAESLFDYASSRLDAVSLRCWIIQRLMLDNGLDHEIAEQAFEQAVGMARAAAATSAPRRRPRRGRAPSFTLGRRSATHLP